ncbi:ATP-sensitive inward rectifier potassium channel 10 [Telmatospirillum siberiense]|uniref:ATP-sensitive inward rectifier potassium channel 10 n=1 Tax=Telmatospirillum siberiense TaxID=382514 RepID=A0A2N3PSL3_9PROT|nr:ATP-sensitive inward rectifier potassium channel 10 [Telmatospirillum siberiense]
MLTTSRGKFAAVLVVGYFVLNTFFALAYVAGGGIENARPGAFEDAFFFSVQTMATIGYGKMVPTSTLANVLVTIEAGVGLFGIAVSAALMFSRFTRATAGILFSRQAVVTRLNGVPTLMFRLANERNDLIHEARIHVVLVRTERSPEGHEFRRLRDLALERSFTPILGLSWTIMHKLDKDSPLYGCTADAARDEELQFIVHLAGHHEGFQQEVHSRWAYSAKDIAWGARFADLFRLLPDGGRALDYACFNQIVADPEPEA